MGYATIPDDLPGDPRWAAVDRRSVPGLLGWLTVFHCHAQRYRTDGVLMYGLMLARASAYARPHHKVMSALVRAGFLTPLTDGRHGWELVGYLEHNASSKVRREKAAKAAQARWQKSASPRHAPSNAPSMPDAMLRAAQADASLTQRRKEQEPGGMATPAAEPTRLPGLSRAQLGSDNGLSPDEAKQRIASVIARLAGGSEAP